MENNRTTPLVVFSLFSLFYFSCSSVFAQKLVLAGDNPDPTVIKIGKYYWSSSTTSNWLPAFPLMQSSDLVHWKIKGSVFSSPPEWADYYFWAPELSYEKGKVYLYYAAHKKNGNLCIAVAQADSPEGPYKDLGPIECQADGSIDAFPIRDENGKLFLVWKEDANSINLPTSIWAQEMRSDRKALLGEKKELFRNTQKWEGNLVEGVSIFKHHNYYYAFYAASGCCGIACTYAIGIARSKRLLGPWEKFDKNPVMANDSNWICPGHGTAIEKNGKFYFLHHAYDRKTIPFTGRQGLLSEFKFTSDDWIAFIKEKTNKDGKIKEITTDNFSAKMLSPHWQWSVFQNIDYKMKGGILSLYANDNIGAYIGQKITSGNYEAITELLTRGTNAAAGLAVIGDDDNMITLLLNNNSLQLKTTKLKNQTILLSQKIPSVNKLYLKVVSRGARSLYFYYSLDGKVFYLLNKETIDASFLPPWDRALRVGLKAEGEKNTIAHFKSFVLKNK